MSITGIAAGGMQDAQNRLDRTAERVARPESPPEDTVELLSAKNQFATNARVLKAADEMTKHLLDILV